MKKHFFYFLALFLISAGNAIAQSEIVVGDMDNSGDLTISDVTALTETIVGRQAVRRISLAGDPYAADNTSIVGQWTGSKGSVTFNADGTTDYKSGYTYEYLPSQCIVMFFDADGDAVESLEVMKLTSSKLVLANMSMTEYYTYGDRVKIVVDENGMTYYEDANGHRFVDLGLPSGTLWATCNIGADNPEDTATTSPGARYTQRA